MLAALLSLEAFAQNANVRTFSQPKAAIEKALHSLQPTSGRLPTLEGFVQEEGQNLKQFQRGFYECSVAVAANSSGGSTVHVQAKITAWYQDPTAAKSGYRALPSNGRLEADLLDRLDDALQNGAAPVSSAKQPSNSSIASKTSDSDSSAPKLMAPMPQLPTVNNPLTGSSIGAPSSDRNGVSQTQRQPHQGPDGQLAALLNEEKNLEEILRNQNHPNNLAAVKKNGAPVLASPAEGAKILFTAAPEDEFEVLDENTSWVHVRISGLSRGWILRANLEMPGDAVQGKSSEPSQQFRVTNDQIVSFPGDWEPLRGKTVKIVSVQATSDSIIGWRAKLDYAKTVFRNDYEALAASGGESGEVLIFDAQDGGMIAATLENVKKWRDGALTDDAFWKICYFDPPETFGAASQ